MKMFLVAISIMGCAVATAKPHPPKHMPPHARVCRECHGHGVIRTWKKMWLGMRQCRRCDGQGYFAPKPPPPPKSHGIKHARPKAHDRRHDSPGKRPPAPPKHHREKSRGR